MSMNRPSGEAELFCNCVHGKEEYKESESEVGNEILKHPAALSISHTSSLEAQLQNARTWAGYGDNSADHFCGNACFRGSV